MEEMRKYRIKCVDAGTPDFPEKLKNFLECRKNCITGEICQILPDPLLQL